MIFEVNLLLLIPVLSINLLLLSLTLSTIPSGKASLRLQLHRNPTPLLLKGPNGLQALCGQVSDQSFVT